MSKEEDQRLYATYKAWLKWLRIYGLKALAVFFAVGLPVIGLIPAIPLWLKACRLQGPDLGKKPGRARMGIPADDMKKMLRQ